MRFLRKLQLLAQRRRRRVRLMQRASREAAAAAAAASHTAAAAAASASPASSTASYYPNMGSGVLLLRTEARLRSEPLTLSLRPDGGRGAEVTVPLFRMHGSSVGVEVGVSQKRRQRSSRASLTQVITFDCL